MSDSNLFLTLYTETCERHFHFVTGMQCLGKKSGFFLMSQDGEHERVLFCVVVLNHGRQVAGQESRDI